MIYWSWVGFNWSLIIMSLSLVSDISNIARVPISSAVGNNLGAAIWKSYAILSSGSIAIPVLILLEVGTRVVISNSIAKLVNSWLIIGWFWGWVENWSWVSNNNRLVNHNRGRMEDWCRLVHNWSWVGNNHRLVHNRGSM